MNSFSPAETLDIVASAIAACGAPVPDCGSCCDWDCCGALGWSCAESRTTGRTRSPTNAQVASRVVMNRSIRCQHEKTNADEYARRRTGCSESHSVCLEQIGRSFRCCLPGTSPLYQIVQQGQEKEGKERGTNDPADDNCRQWSLNLCAGAC